ncbi:homoprotocatechuate degradation operon regulator HpaR [Ilumatobacter sp.]|uniref:homoprotocatechuate degradation operon regulator HpaR n=1 Tax=Ilumatobacter sp. TaxID=1967498 RepID=UPI003752CF12
MSEALVATIPLRAFEDSLPMALMRARESVMRYFRPALSDRDLTEQQWRVLRALRDAKLPMSVGELADRTFLLGPSLSRMLASMDERGLIERATAPDARRAEISISTRGLELVSEIAPSSERAYGRIDALLDPGELDVLYGLLAKLSTDDQPTDGQPIRNQVNL